jgi:hypothetical protein
MSVEDISTCFEKSIDINNEPNDKLEQYILNDICRNWIKLVPLQDELLLQEFSYKEYFEKVADVVLDDDVNRKGDKLRNTVIKFVPLDARKWNKEVEWVYCIVINGKIVKIGGTRTGMKGRATSYS